MKAHGTKSCSFGKALLLVSLGRRIAPGHLILKEKSKQVVDIKIPTERKKELNVKRLTTTTPLPKVPSIKEMSHS